jgi:hypothetical protein
MSIVMLPPSKPLNDCDGNRLGVVADRRSLMTHIAERRLSRVVLLALAVALAAAALTSPAYALNDHWQCGNYGSAQTCWAGTGYHGYNEVVNQLTVDRYAVCAKGQTEAGNTRTGAGDGCAYNVIGGYRISCFGLASPNTAAYIYWAGSGQNTTNYGSARSPGENYYC